MTEILKHSGKGMGGGRINSEFGINIDTLLYIKQIINKGLLYSTGNCTQYSVITCMGKKYRAEWRQNIYIYKTESLCCIPETKTAS